MGGTAIGLLHPGEMGAAVAGCLTARGHEVRWVSEGRGPATAARAAQAGLADAGTVTALARETGIILSVCPPHAALPTARAVAAAGFPGVYVDANAISPGTACDVQAVVEGAGGRYVDGGIVGSPPAGPAVPEGSADGTRLYLAAGSVAGDGDGPAAQVAALFDRITVGSARSAHAASTPGVSVHASRPHPLLRRVVQERRHAPSVWSLSTTTSPSSSAVSTSASPPGRLAFQLGLPGPVTVIHGECTAGTGTGDHALAAAEGTADVTTYPWLAGPACASLTGASPAVTAATEATGTTALASRWTSFIVPLGAPRGDPSQDGPP
jgi:hypothetical protein